MCMVTWETISQMYSSTAKWIYVACFKVICIQVKSRTFWQKMSSFPFYVCVFVCVCVCVCVFECTWYLKIQLLQAKGEILSTATPNFNILTYLSEDIDSINIPAFIPTQKNLEKEHQVDYTSRQLVDALNVTVIVVRNEQVSLCFTSL